MRFSMSELRDELQTLLGNNYKNKDGSYSRLITHHKLDLGGETIPEEQDGKVKAKDLDELLLKMKNNGASDLHLVVGAPPKFRVNGELREIRGYAILTPKETERLLSPLLDEETQDIFERDGDLDFAYSKQGLGRFRVNLLKQRGTWAAVFRALADSIPSADVLGLPTSITDLVSKKRGLILVTGPTGSGKSTTLASLIDMINHKYRKNIITLEDPIEYLHKHGTSNVIQREMGVDSKNFASALRASLREDPDVILVGEMRDFETISTAITAAETGHLVFSTLHTIGAGATIDRILDTYPASQQSQARSQLATVIEGVISQQLIPKADLQGRIAAFEIMTGSTAIKSQIREGKTEQLSGTIQISKQDGMQLLDDHLRELLEKGLINAESAIEFSVDKKTMLERIKLKQ